MTKGKTDELLFVVRDGTCGNASELVFLTRAEFDEYSLNKLNIWFIDDRREFEDKCGDDLWKFIQKSTDRTPGVPQSVLDELL